MLIDSLKTDFRRNNRLTDVDGKEKTCCRLLRGFEFKEYALKLHVLAVLVTQFHNLVYIAIIFLLIGDKEPEESFEKGD